jgi:hypothetical protein
MLGKEVQVYYHTVQFLQFSYEHEIRVQSFSYIVYYSAIIKCM